MDRRAALFALLLSCCAGVEEPGPRLLALSPSMGDGASPVAVEILGANFQPRVVTDFSHSRKSALTCDFQGFLLPSGPGLPEIALGEVSLESSQKLTATIPAGISRGLYGVKIIDPFGRTAVLPEVYRAVRSAGDLAAFQVAALGFQRAGVPFWLEIIAVDAQGAALDGFAGTVSLANRTESISPTTLGPFALGRARALVAVSSVANADAIEVSDGLGHVGRSNDFAVGPGLAVQVAFSSAAQAFDAGGCSDRFELELRDAQDRSAVADGRISVELSASPPQRVTFYSDGACSSPATSAAFAAGAARTGFYVRAEAAGALMVRAQPQALPSAAQLQTIRALSPRRLEFTTPSRPLAAGACSMALALQATDALGNPSAASAGLAVALAAIPPGSLSFFSDDACAIPWAGGALGSSGSLELFARGAFPGAAAVRATAQGAALTPALLVLAVTP